MKISNLDLLMCIRCDSIQLDLLADNLSKIDKDVQEGILVCKNCLNKYPIKNGIPFFFDDKENAI